GPTRILRSGSRKLRSYFEILDEGVEYFLDSRRVGVENHHLTPPRLFLFWILDKPAPRARVRLFQIRGSTRHRLFLMIQLCPAQKHLPAAQHLRRNPSKAARVSAVIA
ncbi:hypothetical protein HPB47_027534, partial [Ixodes persulcatus]